MITYYNNNNSNSRINMAIDMLKKLPEELLQVILSYDDRFKYRNGQWMTQIPKNDRRYSLLQNINRNIIIITENDKRSFILIGKKCFITIYWGYNTNKMYNNVEYYYKFGDKKYEIYTLQ